MIDRSDCLLFIKNDCISKDDGYAMDTKHLGRLPVFCYNMRGDCIR